MGIWRWETLALICEVASQLSLMTSTSYHDYILIHPQIIICLNPVRGEWGCE